MRRFLGGCLLLFLGGCASPVLHVPEKPSQYAQWQQDRVHAWRNHPEWAVHGRVLLQFSGRSHRAGFFWEKKLSGQSLSLNGAPGMGIFQIAESAEGASLTHGREQIKAPTINALLRRQLGWEMDMDSLQKWIWGVVESPRHVAFDQAGQLAWIETEEWVLEYSDYRRVGKLIMPFRIDARNESRKHRVLIKLNRWVLHD